MRPLLPIRVNLFNLITYYLLKSTNCEAPYFEVFCILLLHMPLGQMFSLSIYIIQARQNFYIAAC
jgi:hypothetical protein